MNNHNKPDYSSSFTDLMASLAVVFLILAGGVTILLSMKSKKVIEKNTTPSIAIDNAKDQLRGKFAEILGDKKESVEIRTEGNTVRVIFAGREGKENPLNFPLNDFRLSDNNSIFVRTKIKSLVEVACLFRGIANTHVNLILLEGHTDSSFNPRGDACHYGSKVSSETRSFCNNVRLSSQRATEVFFHLQNSIEDGTELFKCIRKRFLVSGRGSASPRNPREAGHLNVEDADRRVELVFHILPDLNSGIIE